MDIKLITGSWRCARRGRSFCLRQDVRSTRRALRKIMILFQIRLQGRPQPEAASGSPSWPSIRLPVTAGHDSSPSLTVDQKLIAIGSSIVPSPEESMGRPGSGSDNLRPEAPRFTASEAPNPEAGSVRRPAPGLPLPQASWKLQSECQSPGTVRRWLSDSHHDGLRLARLARGPRQSHSALAPAARRCGLGLLDGDSGPMPGPGQSRRYRGGRGRCSRGRPQLSST